MPRRCPTRTLSFTQFATHAGLWISLDAAAKIHNRTQAWLSRSALRMDFRTGSIVAEFSKAGPKYAGARRTGESRYFGQGWPPGRKGELDCGCRCFGHWKPRLAPKQVA